MPHSLSTADGELFNRVTNLLLHFLRVGGYNCSKSDERVYRRCLLTVSKPSKSNMNGVSPKLASTISPGVCSPTVGYSSKPA